MCVCVMLESIKLFCQVKSIGFVPLLFGACITLTSMTDRAIVNSLDFTPKKLLCISELTQT